MMQVFRDHGRQQSLRQVLDGGYDAASDNLVAYGKQPEAPGDRTTDLSKSTDLQVWSAMESSKTNPTSTTRKRGRLTLQRSPFQNRIATGKHLCPKPESSVVMVDRVHPAMVERFGNKD